ncbi:hypothetical protein PHYPO_G00090800 [Pangasianodon hypophthalmus]|uniref:p53 tetramerisation domain-containing protein n=1 Tax=Pangasianodon hypophthalmus TaxID=310915 RepID=A0A5N5LBX1_PANHP|nr:hypothetical protein PHYPO_G00090800 [Pangasianodon hypophthalmus]
MPSEGNNETGHKTDTANGGKDEEQQHADTDMPSEGKGKIKFTNETDGINEMDVGCSTEQTDVNIDLPKDKNEIISYQTEQHTDQVTQPSIPQKSPFSLEAEEMFAKSLPPAPDQSFYTLEVRGRKMYELLSGISDAMETLDKIQASLNNVNKALIQSINPFKEAPGAAHGATGHSLSHFMEAGTSEEDVNTVHEEGDMVQSAPSD